MAVDVQVAEGKIVEVLGPVVDVEFPANAIPEINYALEVIDPLPEGVPSVPRLVLEVAQGLGNNWVRCVSITPTEGLRRGMRVLNTGRPITVPVGQPTLGRIFNVLADPVDNGAPIPPRAER